MIRSASSGSTASSGGGRRTKPWISSRSSARSGLSVAAACSRAERQSASPASTSSLASDAARSERTVQTPPPQTKNAFRSLGSSAGAIRQSLEPAQPLQPPQALDEVLERLDPIPQPGSLLVAEALGQVREPLPQAR